MPPATRPKLNSSNSSHVASNSSNSSIVASAAPLLLLALHGLGGVPPDHSLSLLSAVPEAPAPPRVTSAFERWRAARGTAPSAPPKLAPRKPALPGRRPPARPPPDAMSDGVGLGLDLVTDLVDVNTVTNYKKWAAWKAAQDAEAKEAERKKEADLNAAARAAAAAKAAEPPKMPWENFTLPFSREGLQAHEGGGFDLDYFLTVITPISWPFEFYKNATTIETGDPNDNTKNASMTIGRMTTWQKAIWSLSGLIGSAGMKWHHDVAERREQECLKEVKGFNELRPNTPHEKKVCARKAGFFRVLGAGSIKCWLQIPFLHMPCACKRETSAGEFTMKEKLKGFVGFAGDGTDKYITGCPYGKFLGWSTRDHWMFLLYPFVWYTMGLFTLALLLLLTLLQSPLNSLIYGTILKYPIQ